MDENRKLGISEQTGIILTTGGKYVDS